MRLTCLKCGHQFEVATGPAGQIVGCICGTQFDTPGVINTGVQPDERTAERLRAKAFRAAGLVRNVGGFAFGISLLGVLFFPLGVVGAAIGVYCLTMLRGPVARYSGRRWAILAIVLGATVFAVEGITAMTWLERRQAAKLLFTQESVKEDLKRLRRAQVLYRANYGRYGDFTSFRFKPATGNYTVYLSSTSYFPADRGGEIVDPLPDGFTPGVGIDDFTAVAVANLDGDPYLDVWVMSAADSAHQVHNDIDDTIVPAGEDVTPTEGDTRAADGESAGGGVAPVPDPAAAAHAAETAHPGAPAPAPKVTPASITTVPAKPRPPAASPAPVHAEPEAVPEPAPAEPEAVPEPAPAEPEAVPEPAPAEPAPLEAPHPDADGLAVDEG